MKNARDIAATLLQAFLLALMLGATGMPVQADGLVSNSSGGGEDQESDEDKKSEDQKEEDEAGNAEDDCGTKGGPVSLFDGKELTARTDLVVRGLYPITITRQYDSRSKYDSQLGYGWSLNHDRRLYQYPDGSVVIRYGCGSRDRFVYTGGAYVTPSQGRQGTLIENPDGSFVYNRRYGTREFYDAEGRITAVQNKYGHRHEYTYNPAGKLPLTGTSPYAVDPSAPMTVAYQHQVTKIEERAADGTLTGNFVTLAYNPATGRLVSVTASDGRSVGYVHDTTAGLTQGNLEQVNGLESIVATYRYEDPNDSHNLTYVQNEQGATAWVNTYDTLDRLVQQGYGNNTMVFNYVVDYTETTVTETIRDANGLNPYNIETTWEFDASGDVTLMRDHEGNESVFVRDIRGDLVSRKYYENQGTVAVPSLVLQREINFSYDVMGRVTSRSVTLDSGEIITHEYTYDNDWLATEQLVSSADPAKIFRTEYDFYRDGSNNPTNISHIRRRKSDGSYLTITFTYDVKNRLIEALLPDGQKIVNAYEGGSLYVTKQYFEIGAAESPNGRNHFAYDSRGNLIQSYDARDNLVQLVYDDLGRVTSVTNPLGEESHYSYEGYSLSQTDIGWTVADGEGQVTRYSYTPQGWLSLIEEKDSNDSWHPVVSYKYDSAGQQLTATDSLSNTDTYAYDGFGQIVSVTDPQSNSTTFDYDMFGNQILTIDAAGRQTITRYNDLDWPVEIEQQGVSPAAISTYTYDANGSILSLTDGEGKQTSYTYDTLSRLTSISLPLGQLTQYVYDDRNRLDYRINARGQKIDYSYEPWGPVSTVAWYPAESSSQPLRTISYGLDVQGNITSVTDDAIKATPLYTYTYDALNLPDVTTVTYIPGGDRTLDDGYDRYGNRDILVFTDGSTYTHTWNYDERDRLVSAILPGSQNYSFAYYSTGQLQQVAHPNGMTTTYTYRDNGPVESVTLTGSSGNIAQFSYTYDSMFNVDSMTDADGLHDYAYDGLDRLSQATYPAIAGLLNENYSYDRVGNREDAVNSLLYEYDDNNRITQGPAMSYVFDNDGNLLSRSDGSTLTYDEADRLVSFNKAGTTATYSYDPWGRRIRKTVNGVTTWFLWDDTDLIAEFDGSGNRIARYAYNPLDFTATQIEDANGTYDVHGDSQQFPRLLTNSAQQVVWSSRYSVFGMTNVAGGNVAFPQRFPGQYEDEESGFFYNYYRYYDPAIGRYVTADPVQNGDNWYIYANDNSLAYIDPAGLIFCGLGDKLKSAGWLGVSGAYYAISTVVMEPALDAVDGLAGFAGVDSDLAGQWGTHVTDNMVRVGSVHINRIFGRADSDDLGGKIFAVPEKIHQTVKSVKSVKKAVMKAKKLQGYVDKPSTQSGLLKRNARRKGAAPQSIRQMLRNARMSVKDPAKRRKWARRALEASAEMAKSAYDMTNSAIKSGMSLGENIVDTAASVAEALTDRK